MENKRKSKSNSGIKTGIATSVIVIAVLVAFIMPASATTNGCPLETKYNGTIHGGIYFQTSAKELVWMQNPLTYTFEDVPDKSKIKVARLYTGVWGGSSGKGGNYTITVNSNSSEKYRYCDPCLLYAQNCDPWQEDRCDALNATNSSGGSGEIHHYTTGCNVNFISYDVFDNITTGTNSVTVTTEGNNSCTKGAWDGRVYLVALLVVYEDSGMPEMTYWIDEGAPYMDNTSDCSGHADEIYNWFNGTYVSPYKMKYWTLGFPHVANSPTMTLNGNPIGQPDYKEVPAGYEVFFRWDNLNTGWLTSNNLFYYYEPDASYERIYSAVLAVREFINKPDLIVTDVGFPTVMRPGKDYTINATIRNDGDVAAGSFNVSLYANEDFKGKKSISELNPGASTTVNFDPMGLPYGCYKFKVVADSNDVIEEFNEGNNNWTEYYQVGYVIVVKSNSDFEALLDDAYLPAGSVTKEDGTYYIQNLNVENCAGRGIWIENTNVPFVINNCVVNNCKEHGVDLAHLTNGKIENCVVKDNQLNGIRFVNSNNGDIMNNLVQNNSGYGIDVYPENMPTVDCEFINITNNIVEKKNQYGIELYGTHCIVRDNILRNSTGYGIYMYGDSNEIYNNTIKYNDDYGVKIDSGSGNCIYGNNFIDNGGTSQGYDSGDNSWNSTVKLGYYNDTSSPFDNYMGNYWSDYGGVDANNDKIGEDIYDIDGGTEKDNSPLMASWGNYGLVLCGDVNCDSAVNVGDVYPVFRRVYGDPVCSDWAADVNCDGAINVGDVYPVFRRAYGDPVNCCKACEQP